MHSEKRHRAYFHVRCFTMLQTNMAFVTLMCPALKGKVPSPQWATSVHICPAAPIALCEAGILGGGGGGSSGGRLHTNAKGAVVLPLRVSARAGCNSTRQRPCLPLVGGQHVASIQRLERNNMRTASRQMQSQPLVVVSRPIWANAVPKHRSWLCTQPCADAPCLLQCIQCCICTAAIEAWQPQ